MMVIRATNERHGFISDPTPLISPAGRLGSCLDEDRPLESLCPDQAWPTETSRPRMTWRILLRSSSGHEQQGALARGASHDAVPFAYGLMITRVENLNFASAKHGRRRVEWSRRHRTIIGFGVAHSHHSSPSQ